MANSNDSPTSEMSALKSADDKKAPIYDSATQLWAFVYQKMCHIFGGFFHNSSTPPVYTNPCTVMPTQEVEVVNPQSGETIRSNVFFDSGCYCTFIREDLAKSLKLVPIRSETIWTSAFGNHVKSEKCSVYNLQLTKKDGHRVDLVVYSTSGIDRCYLPEVVSTDHEKKNPNLRTVVPGILIGSDRFWDFVISRGPLHPSGLRTIKTVFGCFATGLTAPIPPPTIAYSNATESMLENS